MRRPPIPISDKAAEANRCQYGLVIEWLFEEINRTGLHGFHRERNIAMTGHCPAGLRAVVN